MQDFIANSSRIFSKFLIPYATFLLRTTFVFDEPCLEAFQTLRDALTKAPIIQPPDWSLPFEIMCDPSDFALGAVLGQRVDKKPVVIYYVSHILSEAQLNYTTTEKKLLALIFVLE